MSALQRFENKLEQMISGVFARTFRSAVQPVEISAALNRELDNSAQILSRDRRLVPNDFHVELSQADHERLAALGPQLVEELAGMLRDYAGQQSYVFTGPVNIALEQAEDLTTGRFRVRSASVSQVSQPGRPAPPLRQEPPGPPPPGPPPPGPPPPGHGPDGPGQSVPEGPRAGSGAGAVLVVNGRELPLSPPGLVIGRSNDADLRIDDPGVSRRHLEVRVVDTAGGTRVSVRDLGSTNGVLVNGRRVESATLADGADIRIGNTTLTLRQPGQPHGGTG